MRSLLRSLLLITPLLAAACHADLPSRPPPTTIDTPANTNADLEALYRLAVEAFDEGAYDDAANQFAQLVLRVPTDESGDQLRHLLVQHLGWSLLGAYDMSGDASKLDSGEAMLERYLVKHEELFPAAIGERVEIYDLLGQYTLRRDGQPPPDANMLLQALVQETYSNLQRPSPRNRPVNDDGMDRMVREIDVHTIRWASLDDPRVQRYFRDPRYTGSSMFEFNNAMNPARVLVRGWVGDPLRASVTAKRRTWDTLRVARPALEQCYEDALGRGASAVERLAVEFHWDERSPAKIQITEQTLHDTDTSRCVIDALHVADAMDSTESTEIGRDSAELRLTFFVQAPKYAPTYGGGGINQEGKAEDVSISSLRFGRHGRH